MSASPSVAAASSGDPVPLAPGDPELLALLAAHRLPTGDLADSEALFLGLRAPGGGLAAAGGFERHGADALLRSLAVVAEWRGRGLGRQMVEALLAAARDAGIERLFLLTETAEQFFAHFGFRRVERREVPGAIAGSAQFTSLCPSSAVAMTLRLDRARRRGASHWRPATP